LTWRNEITKEKKKRNEITKEKKKSKERKDMILTQKNK